MVKTEELNEAKEPDIRHISEFVSLLAEEMLISGGETRRVEDCVDKILGSFGVDKYDHYIISNGIFMTTELEDKHHFTRMRYVPLGSVNLWKIGALNQLSRDVSDKKCSLDEAKNRLDEIKNTTVYSDRTLALCCAVGCAGFGYIIGASWLDFAVILVLAFLEVTVELIMQRRKFMGTSNTILTSAFVTALIIITAFTGIPIHGDTVIIACLFAMVPGIAFTNSIRDFVKGDYLTGVIHLMSVIMTSCCIAIGALSAMYLLGLVGVSL